LLSGLDTVGNLANCGLNYPGVGIPDGLPVVRFSKTLTKHQQESNELAGIKSYPSNRGILKGH